MKIGITEQGDSSIDFAWKNKINDGTVNGEILITKNITDEFIKKVCECYAQHPQIIVHATCTGWGGSVVEPHVHKYTWQLDQLKKLINNGFPISHCVLRIDPIIPTESGLRAVKHVIDYAAQIGLLPDIRIRISVLDEYRHVKKRLNDAGYASFYPGDDFQAPQNMVNDLIATLEQYPYEFETCAEGCFSGHNQFKAQGCISQKDLDIMGLAYNGTDENIQNRHGCHCLACKTEMLSCKHQCPNGCLYCYWRS